MMLKCHRRSRAATRLGGSHAKVFYRVRDGRPPEVDHRLRPRRGHRRGRGEEVPRQPLGRDRRVDGRVPRAVARGLRERLPRLRPAEGARRARRRVRRRRGLEDPQVGRRLGLQERQERRRQDGQGDTRPTTSPPYGSPPPRSKASGTSPAPTTGRPRAWRPPSSGCSPSSQSEGSPTAAPRPPATRGSTGPTTS
jgi:hypothetical protein